MTFMKRTKLVSDYQYFNVFHLRLSAETSTGDFPLIAFIITVFIPAVGGLMKHYYITNAIYKQNLTTIQSTREGYRVLINGTILKGIYFGFLDMKTGQSALPRKLLRALLEENKN